MNTVILIFREAIFPIDHAWKMLWSDESAVSSYEADGMRCLTQQVIVVCHPGGITPHKGALVVPLNAIFV